MRISTIQTLIQTKLGVVGLTKEKLMIDSGAQCCVCPLNYAPEIEMVRVDRRELPDLHSVTGAAMRIEGVKYVKYRLSGHHEMTVRYYVTDVGGPILSVNGLNQSGYSPVLSENPYLLHYKDYITKLEKVDGLYYIISYGKYHYVGPVEKTRIIVGSTTSEYWKIEGGKAIRVHQMKDYISSLRRRTTRTREMEGLKILGCFDLEKVESLK